MIGRSKMNDRLHDMTPSGMLLDVSVSSKKKRRKRKIQQASNFYPLANEVAKGYRNTIVRPSFLPSVRPSVTSL